MEDSPISRAVHGGQRGQVMGAVEVTLQPVLSCRQVGDRSGGGVGGGGEELH